MKVYLSSDGAILQTIPSTIGRGSTMTDFEVEAPFSAVAITVRFGLRKGTTEPLLLKRVSNVSSPGLNVWTAKLPYAVTEYAGTVTYTIDIQDSDGDVIKSPSGTLSISPGAIPTMPSSPPQDAWTQMINYLSAIYDAAANGSGEIEELESKIAELKRWITDFETTRSVTDDSGEVPVIYKLVKSNLIDRLDELVNTGRTVVGGNAMSLVHDSVLLWLEIWAHMLIDEEMLAGNSVQSEEILQVTGGKHIRFTTDEEMEPILEMLKEYEDGTIGGSPGVYVQDEEPTDPNWTLWIKPTGGYNLLIPAATAEMTQPVGRNADGQLVTAPGGGGVGEVPDWAMQPEKPTYTAEEVGAQPKGDYIPAPETAEVGQTIVVKAVDEDGKPTEWEAATVEKFIAKKLIYSLTTTEQVDVFSIALTPEQQTAVTKSDRLLIEMRMNKADEITTEDTSSGNINLEWSQYDSTSVVGSVPTGNISYINFSTSAVLIDLNGSPMLVYGPTGRVVRQIMVHPQNQNASVTTPNKYIQCDNWLEGVNSLIIRPAYPVGTGSYIKIYALCTSA